MQNIYTSEQSKYIINSIYNWSTHTQEMTSAALQTAVNMGSDTLEKLLAHIPSMVHFLCRRLDAVYLSLTVTRSCKYNQSIFICKAPIHNKSRLQITFQSENQTPWLFGLQRCNISPTSERSATAARKKLPLSGRNLKQTRTQWWAVTGPVDRDHKLFRKLFTEVVNQLGSRVIFS